MRPLPDADIRETDEAPHLTQAGMRTKPSTRCATQEVRCTDASGRWCAHTRRPWDRRISV